MIRMRVIEPEQLATELPTPAARRAGSPRDAPETGDAVLLPSYSAVARQPSRWPSAPTSAPQHSCGNVSSPCRRIAAPTPASRTATLTRHRRSRTTRSSTSPRRRGTRSPRRPRAGAGRPSSAAARAAPELMPTSRPSSRASRRTSAYASSLLTPRSSSASDGIVDLRHHGGGHVLQSFQAVERRIGLKRNELDGRVEPAQRSAGADERAARAQGRRQNA